MYPGHSYFASTAAALSDDHVTNFTQADIDTGHVRLVHQGPASQHLMLRVTDAKQTSDYYRLDIVGVSLSLRAVRNTGLVVQLPRTSSVVITSDNLTFSCGAVHQNIDVRYELLSTPRHGSIERRQLEDDWRLVMTFTQRQIDDRRVRYRLNDETLTTPAADRLTFRVGALAVRDSRQHVLNVDIVERRVELVRSTGLTLHQGVRQGVITASELQAASSDPSHTPADIIYRIVSTPRRGHLLLTSSAERRRSLQTADNFTQADINAERLVYRVQLALMMHIRDDFEFQLVTTDAQSDVALFEFQYEPLTGDVIFVNNGLFDVLEGSHKLIGLENIYVETVDRNDFRYNVVEAPMHGQLRITDPESGDILQYNATTFDNDDIRRQRLYYVHDDSETDHDSFRFVVTPFVSRTTTTDDVVQLGGQFDVEIVLLNDNTPRRLVNSTLMIVENSGRVLTTQDLMYEDPDINYDNERLVYTFRQITNGDIVAASDRTTVIRRFTQRNLTDNELYFRHRGALHASTTFTVNDGLFQVSYI